MPLLVLLILALLWAVVLVPPLLRARTERAGDSIGEFNYRLGVLGRTNGALVRTPMMRPRVTAAKRRRDVARTLAIACALTFLVAYTSGAAVMWATHVLADMVLIGFFALWAWVRSLQQEQRDKVRYLPQSHAPELALRRTASS
ncbi:MAG: hypothetical protein ACT4OX_16255 [Actinomycetota bacterium]